MTYNHKIMEMLRGGYSVQEVLDEVDKSEPFKDNSLLDSLLLRKKDYTINTKVILAVLDKTEDVMGFMGRRPSLVTAMRYKTSQDIPQRVLDALLEKTTCVDHKDRFGVTPMHLALSNKVQLYLPNTFLRRMLKKVKDFTQLNKDGASLLYLSMAERVNGVPMDILWGILRESPQDVVDGAVKDIFLYGSAVAELHIREKFVGAAYLKMSDRGRSEVNDVRHNNNFLDGIATRYERMMLDDNLKKPTSHQQKRKI